MRARPRGEPAMSRLVPPRKADWKPGQLQVGLFLRTEKGSVLECVWDKASPEVKEAAMNLLREGKSAAAEAAETADKEGK